MKIKTIAASLVGILMFALPVEKLHATAVAHTRTITNTQLGMIIAATALVSVTTAAGICKYLYSKKEYKGAPVSSKAVTSGGIYCEDNREMTINSHYVKASNNRTQREVSLSDIFEIKDVVISVPSTLTVEYREGIKAPTLSVTAPENVHQYLKIKKSTQGRLIELYIDAPSTGLLVADVTTIEYTLVLPPRIYSSWQGLGGGFTAFGCAQIRIVTLDNRGGRFRLCAQHESKIYITQFIGNAPQIATDGKASIIIAGGAVKGDMEIIAKGRSMCMAKPKVDGVVHIRAFGDAQVHVDTTKAIREDDGDGEIAPRKNVTNNDIPVERQ